ncbi:hypothetical protein NHX12_013688 [Muraenolepis orangiensis]|uniref:Rho guanine nucleotide exchange factor 11 n=1 Tax=Muraenolepis orangiensis TaxID=630683 RepID=A0A9Q0I4J5_9TELE|nr:hypothetical protein NHX12_013688 [Muraenolepis orangiensis]
MSLRQPSSTLDRLSSLTIGDSERKSSAGQQPRDPPADFPPESTGGAAVKAGVQEGDRIIKVNGSLVSSMSHQEVVKLIKSGPYVALTLQGPPPSTGALPLEPLATDLLPNQRTSLGGEHPEVQKHASQILQKMLQQGEADLQALVKELYRNPSPSLEERIESAKRRAHQVRVKIQQDLDGNRGDPVSNYLLAGEGRLSMDSSEGDAEAFESPHSSPSSFRGPQQRHHGSGDTGGKAQIIGPEEEEEEDGGYALNEMDGPFQDIELLKSRPAHMTVFMRYVFTQLLDPNPLLFYLSVEAYLGSSPKDARSLAPQVRSHFLDPDAPLKIKVPEEYLADIESRLHVQEDIRGPLNKQLMGLGSLFGEGDLQQLDGDPAKERQVVDKQVTALWDILSKHEDERSSPLASAVLLYLRHCGIKLRDSKVFPGLGVEKEKWLPFFPKPKKLSSYIGKPRSTSQSTFHIPLSPTEVRSGSVRNIIQQFENHSEMPEEEGGDGDPQRISSSSLGEDGLDSDVDMEDCGEEREAPGLRLLLQHSASSSASGSSARSLENPTPPYTPRSRRRSVESPRALLPDTGPREVERQAVIYELYTTEVSHLRTLRVLDQVFFQKMRSVLSSEELSCIFPNLPQVYQLHASMCEAMKKRREKIVVEEIGDIMLSRFEGSAGEGFADQASQLCRQQSEARQLLKSKQRKDPRFAQVMQECEASRHCRRLQLKDLLVSEMQRLTKETEHRQHLSQYQRRLDAAPQFKSLDLTAKTMIHEGPLTWKVNKDKTLEIQALLLSDVLVLLQRGPDDRLVLRGPSRWLGGGGGGGGGDSKTSFSPVVRLDSLLVRSVATDNKALYVISATERQMYELVAGTASEKNTWKELLERTISLASGSSPSTNRTSTPTSSPCPVDSPSVLTNSHIDQSDDSVRESSVSLEVETTTSSNHDNGLTDPDEPTDQSGGDGREETGLAEAALQDVESLRLLIFRDLDSDGWSHHSDDTPTNETANGRQHALSLAAVSVCVDESDDTQPGVQVVRRGNTFYLVMPGETGESATDDLDEPPTPTHLPPQAEDERSGAVPMEGEVEVGQSQTGSQSHVIKNVEEIFHTIEGLMSKLHQLKDIENAHHQLLGSLRDQGRAAPPATVARTLSLDRGSGNCNDGALEELKIQSTGF